MMLLSPPTGKLSVESVIALAGTVAVVGYFLTVGTTDRRLTVRGRFVTIGDSEGPPTRILRRHTIEGFVLCFLSIAGVSYAAAPGDMLMQVTTFLMTCCLAGACATLAIGALFLLRLWRELIPQFHGVTFLSALKSLPKSVFWLALGMAGVMLPGLFLDKVPSPQNLIDRVLQARVFATIFFFAASVVLLRVWMSGSIAALLVRTFLLLVFSLILLPAAWYFLSWLAGNEGLPRALLEFAAGVCPALFLLGAARPHAVRAEI